MPAMIHPFQISNRLESMARTIPKTSTSTVPAAISGVATGATRKSSRASAKVADVRRPLTTSTL
jgi:hypothetical protein